jgi:prophage regulatory protein
MKSLRLPAVKSAFGYSSDGAVYLNIDAGLLPKPVKVGPRASAWPEVEIGQILTARAGGASDDQIRALVNKLHDARKAAWAALQNAVGVPA